MIGQRSLGALRLGACLAAPALLTAPSKPPPAPAPPPAARERPTRRWRPTIVELARLAGCCVETAFAWTHGMPIRPRIRRVLESVGVTHASARAQESGRGSA
jgi:hypothetical protein